VVRRVLARKHKRRRLYCVHDERAAEVDRLVVPFLSGAMPQEQRAETG
jgi:hypothetical protein